jgi:glucokinase
VNIIVRLAADGDEVAQSVLREAAAFLGIGLANLVNIIQPTQIVFSGNAFALSPTTRGWIEESTYAHCFDQPKFKFSNATFRNYQGVVGAATAILEKELL